jgi:tRNA U54 and U55 pseudouridine synthase Pus10
MESESTDEELRRKIGKHPLGRMLGDQVPTERPTLNLHWRVDGPQTA